MRIKSQVAPSDGTKNLCRQHLTGCCWENRKKENSFTVKALSNIVEISRICL